jgi:hypothetical protein
MWILYGFPGRPASVTRRDEGRRFAEASRRSGSNSKALGTPPLSRKHGRATARNRPRTYRPGRSRTCPSYHPRNERRPCLGCERDPGDSLSNRVGPVKSYPVPSSRGVNVRRPRKIRRNTVRPWVVDCRRSRRPFGQPCGDHGGGQSRDRSKVDRLGVSLSLLCLCRLTRSRLIRYTRRLRSLVGEPRARRDAALLGSLVRDPLLVFGVNHSFTRRSA